MGTIASDEVTEDDIDIVVAYLGANGAQYTRDDIRQALGAEALSQARVCTYSVVILPDIVADGGTA